MEAPLIDLLAGRAHRITERRQALQELEALAAEQLADVQERWTPDGVPAALLVALRRAPVEAGARSRVTGNSGP